MAGISYHKTFNPPSNQKVVQRLENLENYIHVFYPSVRDWSYSIASNLDQSDVNKELHDYILSWQKTTNLNYGVVTYNNKSNYSGLAITDHLNFARNFDFYFPKKAGLYAYMHPIKKNPGPLKLTNMLFAELGWKSLFETTEVEVNWVTTEYFKSRYGKYAKKWKEIQDQMALSISNAKFIFEAESLSSFVLKNIYWVKPLYSDEEAIQNIPKFLEGGPQTISNGFYSEKDSFYQANFIGLNKSLGIQEALKNDWEHIFLKVKDLQIRRRMKNDI